MIEGMLELIILTCKSMFQLSGLYYKLLLLMQSLLLLPLLFLVFLLLVFRMTSAIAFPLLFQLPALLLKLRNIILLPCSSFLDFLLFSLEASERAPSVSFLDFLAGRQCALSSATDVRPTFRNDGGGRGCVSGL